MLKGKINLRSNRSRRLSIISKKFDNEGEVGEVIDSQLSQPIPSADGLTNRRRLTQIIEIGVDNQSERKGINRLLFVMEPILIGLILFPLLALFWDCGWNLVVTMLNSFNNYTLTYNLDGFNYTDDGYGNYSTQSLIASYAVCQSILFILYLSQDIIYQFLKTQNIFVKFFLLKFHSLLLASLYIVQWEMMWTILYDYCPSDWLFLMLFSLCALFLLIILTGTLSDLVCSPFVVSYDSIECCIQFECPLVLENMNGWKSNFINYILYELLISSLTIIVWFGFYSILDQYLYPDDIGKSIWVCLIIGYTLYFPLMYFQYFYERCQIKNQYCEMFLLNFPQFYRNVYHCLSFASCLFVWHGIWVTYDTYLRIFEKYYETYLMIALLVFVFLSFLGTFSSINGPLKTMEDKYGYFPVYPHYYVSEVVSKISHWSCFRSINWKINGKISPFDNSNNENNNRW